MRTIATATASPGRAARLSLARRIWRRAAALALAVKISRERRTLLRLDDRALKDMGFSRGDAYAEAHRSFWDIPVDRLRR
jgi:uncharacterized protein YjiS (DUF1127 family)